VNEQKFGPEQYKNKQTRKTKKFTDKTPSPEGLDKKPISQMQISDQTSFQIAYQIRFIWP
jgi:hypothetical protein